MNNKSRIVILSLIALAIIGILSGASYAYFSVENKQGNNTVIESGTMALTFTDGPQINATNLIPGEYIEKTFSVRNTGTVSTTYDVYLSEVINTFVQKSDLVYEITSSDGGYNTPSEVVVPNEESKIVNQQSIGVGVTHNYTLKITYKLTNQVQNDNMGRGFIAKININEYKTNNSEHLLKLLDTSNNLVDKQMISSGITDYYYNLANTSLTGTTNIYCNNGGIPTIENNILKVSYITSDTECKMSNDIADTVNNKLGTTKIGIVMTNNQDNVAKMTITSGKEVVLDLNGKEINSAYIYETSTTYAPDKEIFHLYGSLTINDSIGIGGLYIGTTNRPFYINTNGRLIINGGNYNGRNSMAVVGNNSIIEINGGNYNSKYGPIIFMSDNCQNCNMTINNGNFSSNDVDNTIGLYTDGGTMTINGGNFSNMTKPVIYNEKGTTNINGGTFESGNSQAVYNASTGTVNITGGIFKSDGSNTIFNNGNMIIDGNQATFDSNGNYVSGIYVYNELNADQRMIMNYYNGTMIINNGTFISKAGRVINASSGSTLTINNGYFKSISDSGEHMSATLVKEGNSVVNINNGYFESLNGYGIINFGTGTINIKNSTVKTYDFSAILSHGSTSGITNICSVSLLENKYIGNGDGYTYYHTNAFGSVTPTFHGTTANIQVKDSVCD